ncbi:MAG TPA: DUF488 domain-containing protein [Kofleriaceae bacterium]|nr:DUF488 domain-containing protein [Kofleriaceae bacterium]
MRVSKARASQRAAPALFERQRQLLMLLNALGGTAGNLDFQKILFLYCQDPASGSPYEFVPYKFGAFSFTSYADRRKLIERGFLTNDEQQWQLTDAARKALGHTQDLLLTTFARRIGSRRGDVLVAETYRRFPYYATRSEIAERVLRDDAAALDRIEAARPAVQPAAVSTIGYEGRTFERYLNELLRAGITLLCDVRRNPISRKYGFSKSTLAKGCEGVGIRYEHLPELGIASDQRQSLETQADYDALFAEYERKDLPEQGQALAKIAVWIRAGERVALTCYELAATRCHRHCVTEALENQFGRGFAAKHL